MQPKIDKQKYYFKANFHNHINTINGNSPGEAGWPPTIKGTPLKSQFVIFIVTGLAFDIRAIAFTDCVVSWLYSWHSRTNVTKQMFYVRSNLLFSLIRRLLACPLSGDEDITESPTPESMSRNEFSFGIATFWLAKITNNYNILFKAFWIFLNTFTAYNRNIQIFEAAYNWTNPIQSLFFYFRTIRC